MKSVTCDFDAQQSAGRSFSGVQRSRVPSRPPQKGWQWFHPNLSPQVGPFPRYTNPLHVILLTQRLSETQNLCSCWISRGLPALLTFLLLACWLDGACAQMQFLLLVISVFLSSLVDVNPHMPTLTSRFLNCFSLHYFAFITLHQIILYSLASV